MASATAYRSHPQILTNDHDDQTPYSTPKFRPKSRRSPSSGSSPSPSNSSSISLSFCDPCESPVFSPRTPLSLSGIPFSWEQSPGIPKNELSNKKESSLNSLPLPPAGSSSNSFRKLCREDLYGSLKKFHAESVRKDPFFAALMECSKDDREGLGTIFKTSNFTKALADRFAMYTSCKRITAVSESIILLPRSRNHSLFTRRSI